MGLNRREFLKLGGLALVGVGTGALFRGEGPTVSEKLQLTLGGWVADQNYDHPTYNHEALKPLETYAKHLYATSPSRGWMKFDADPAVEVWVGESKTPELLGNSGAVFFKINDEFRGFVWNDYATLSLQGGYSKKERVEGTLTHFSGGEIENYEGTYEAKIPIPADTPIGFLIVWQGPDTFRGNIYFRGHDRAFGGGKDQDSFPKRLMWK